MLDAGYPQAALDGIANPCSHVPCLSAKHASVYPFRTFSNSEKATGLSMTNLNGSDDTEGLDQKIHSSAGIQIYLNCKVARKTARYAESFGVI